MDRLTFLKSMLGNAALLTLPPLHLLPKDQQHRLAWTEDCHGIFIYATWIDVVPVVALIEHLDYGYDPNLDQGLPDLEVHRRPDPQLGRAGNKDRTEVVVAFVTVPHPGNRWS